MASCYWFLVVVALEIVLLSAVSPCAAQNRILVIAEDGIQQSHSIFFDNLLERGYDLTFQSPRDPKLQLSRYGDYLYDHLILFAPTVADFAGSVDINSIVEFVDEGHNLLFSVSTNPSDNMVDLAAEFGVELKQEDGVVIDHFNVHSTDTDGDHSLFVARNFDSKLTQALLRTTLNEPVLFRGVGQYLSGTSSLISPILRASDTAYCVDKELVGQDISLVSVMQARNNARIGVVGSLDFFSDRFFETVIEGRPSGNALFSQCLTGWLFREWGLLRATNVRHYKVEEKENILAESGYRINDTLHFSMEIQEFNGSQWLPYNAEDVQLEFVMLDPYIRVFLDNDGHGHYTTTFQAPDVYGIFTFRVQYRKPGYSYLHVAESVTLRPFRHDEYPRFIPGAYPYYASSFSMMFGLLVFSLVFLYHKPETRK